MKIALILSGHMRGYLQTFDKFKRNILDNNDCDVFISTWETYGWWTSKDTLIDKSNDIIDMNSIYKLYNPKIIKVDNFFDQHESIFAKEALKLEQFAPSDLRYNVRIQNVLSMHFKFQDSIRLWKQYKSKCNITYDLVIKTRPDAIIENIPENTGDIVMFDGGQNSKNIGLGDIYISGSESQIAKFDRLYEMTMLLCSVTNYYCPHVLMEEYCKTMKISYSRLNRFRLHNARNGMFAE